MNSSFRRKQSVTANMVEKTRRSRRRRKSSRYLPLLWLITGALLALVLIFSGNLVISASGVSSSVTNTNKSEKPQPIPSFPSSKTQERESEKTVKIYLARQLEKGVRLVSHSIIIPSDKSPLQTTLQALLNTRETEDLNLIPLDSKLRKVWITNNYAYIDFSEEFGYNAYGLQGYKLQVYQIVLTACQFENIRGVYFFIEGKPLKYLGGEGFPVPQPATPPKEPFEIPY